MTTPKKYILSCCLFLFTISVNAQVFRSTDWGFNIGLVSALGNKFQRIGFTFQTYYSHDFAQVNAEVRMYRNFKNLGPQEQHNELVTAAGLLLGYGAKQTEHNPFLSSVSNQTRYTNSVGYSYNVYFNKVKTTQQTGILALQFNSISIISENDILARPTLDRFRTGAFLLQYQYKDLYQFAVNCTMWTGTLGREIHDKDFPFTCYKDTTGGVYTKYSHGLLSGQFKLAMGHGQNLQANIGADAQQVRDFVQNRVIHDMIIVPHKWLEPNNCHLPMLDTEGNQYLYKPNQKIKPAQFYWNIFSGAAVFY